MLNTPCLHINYLKRWITTQKIHVSNEFLNRGLESLQTSFMISQGCWSIWKWQWIKISISSRSSYLHHKQLFTNSNYKKPSVTVDGALIISLAYFSFSKSFKEGVYLFGTKSKFLYVLPPLFECLSTTIFNLWMLMNANDVFALVANFINLDQQP
jgi:hypothetical protein